MVQSDTMTCHVDKPAVIRREKVWERHLAPHLQIYKSPEF
jgi:hypothetical protein